ALKDGLRYEITTYRAEAYDPGTRNPVVTFGDSLEEDLVRRDFTVNSMALSLPALELVDPFGGVSDLAAGRLRTPSSPRESFTDDPLRMLRAARFLAGYHLVPVDELVSAVSELVGRIGVVSRERIRDEMDKLLVVDRPSAGLKFLVDTGLAAEFIP
ncbi:tRNA nucleotidyltransferase, partial [mine drainage metagenome]